MAGIRLRMAAMLGLLALSALPAGAASFPCIFPS
jgi:hypothetical protein